MSSFAIEELYTISLQSGILVLVVSQGIDFIPVLFFRTPFLILNKFFCGLVVARKPYLSDKYCPSTIKGERNLELYRYTGMQMMNAFMFNNGFDQNAWNVQYCFEFIYIQ